MGEFQYPFGRVPVPIDYVVGALVSLVCYCSRAVTLPRTGSNETPRTS